MEIKAKTNVVVADRLCDFNPKLFGIDEMPDEEIRIMAEGVAEKIAEATLPSRKLQAFGKVAIGRNDEHGHN